MVALAHSAATFLYGPPAEPKHIQVLRVVVAVAVCYAARRKQYCATRSRRVGRYWRSVWWYTVCARGNEVAYCRLSGA
eukprot:2103735-Rhodomonas_salina.3